MYTSDKKNNALYSQQVLVNLFATVFFALFGAVYEIFSHEVYSFYMIYAFAVPLVLGVLPFSILQVRRRKKRIGRTDKRTDKRGCFFWNCGILTLATGCACKGALDIYGTTNRLLLVYPAAGLMLLAAGAILLPARQQASEEKSSGCAPAADSRKSDRRGQREFRCTIETLE